MYSYQDAQNIDFTALTSAHLFGIFGAVGCGKSTLLEAITYALYGESERLNSRDSRNYNMMNLKSDRLYIEFDFKAPDQQLYRATAEAKRNLKNFEQVSTIVRKAYRQVDNQWIPIEAGLLESVIGLSYENFKRIVIIPQGRFQEFLQLGDKERTSMMQQLFPDLNRYDLFDKANGLYEQTIRELEHYQILLQNLGDLNPETLLQLQQQLLEARAQLETQKQQTEALTILEQQWNQAAELHSEWMRLTADLETHSSREAEMNERTRLLDEYERCRMHLKSPVDRLHGLAVEIAQLETENSRKQLQFTSVNEQLDRVSKEFLQVKTRFDTRETLKTTAEELKKLIEIRLANEKWNQLQIRLTKGAETLAQTETRLVELQQTLETQLLELVELKKRLPDVTRLSNVKQWFTVHKSQVERKEQLIRKIELLTTQLRDKQNAFLDFIQPRSYLLGVDRLENALRGCQIEKQRLLDEQTGLRQQLDEVQLQHQLERFSVALHQGDSCPLCGSTQHPHPLQPGDSQQRLAHFKQLLAQNEQALQMVADTALNLNRMEAEQTSLSMQLQELQQELRRFQNELDLHRKGFIWPEFEPENEQKLNETFDESVRLTSALETLEQLITQHRKNIETEQQNKKKYDEALQQIRNDQTGEKQKAQLLGAQLQLVKPSDWEKHSNTELGQQADQLVLQYLELTKTYEKLDRELRELETENTRLKAGIEETTQTLTAKSAEYAQLRIQIDQLIDKHQFSNLAQVEKLVALSIDSVEERRQIAQFNENKAILSARLDHLRVQIALRPYQPQEHEQVKLQLMAAKEQLNEKARVTGKLENEESLIKQQLEQQSQWQQKGNELQIRADNLKELRQLFAGGKFVNYVSSIYLQNLCNAANERFYKMTRQRLRLELTENNNFQVRDFTNEGKTRSVKTLSGGQTFQAALSLALALTDNLQQLSGSNQNFFFLDEGFGTLDSESLQVVFDTLKNLRRENRVVGIISHVSEMQQEIENHLFITNDEARGSLVRESWR